MELAVVEGEVPAGRYVVDSALPSKRDTRVAKAAA